jgi:flagellar hook-associated protein 2
MPGVTFTVLSKATGVTVSTAADPSAIASKITAMVQAANTALDTITKYASYDPGTKTAGPLLSDQTVRLLQDSILGVVSGTVAGGKTLDSVGLSLTKDGHLTFDANAFATAYKANPAQTAALFQAGGSFTATAGSSFSGTVSFESATQLTKQGAYAVHISQAATRASATIDTSAGISAGQVINLGSNGQSLSYTTDGTETVATLAQKLNALAAQNSVGIAVTVNGTQLAVQTQQYGAGFSLSASATGGLVASPVTAGQDVAGTINGVTAKGAGQLLIAPPSDPTLGGLTLNVTMTAADVAAQGAGNAGLFTYAPGAAQQYGSLAQGVTNPISGQITLAVNSLNGDINDLTQQIADWNDRLQIVQQMYQQEFSNLEVQLGQLRDQSSWLSGSLAGLGGGASMPSSPPPSSGGH